MNKNKSGVLVEHDDGRRGIAYRKDQRIRNDGKLIIQFVDENMNKDGAKRAVKKSKLTQIGFVD